MAEKVRLFSIIILLVGAFLLTGCFRDAVSSGDTVTVDYTLTLEDGSVYYTTEGQSPARYSLGEDAVLPGFEEALIGMRIGETKTVVVPPEKAYGEHLTELVGPVSRDRFPEQIALEVGKRLQTTLTDGTKAIVIITEIDEETVTVDANHPLAGHDLTFTIELLSMEKRTATGMAGQTLLIWIPMAALLILVITFILYYRRTSRRSQQAIIDPATEESRRMLGELADLDDDFEAGNIGEAEYRHSRARIKSRIVKLRGQ